MDNTGSLLMTTVARIRTYLDDPSLDAKYNNDFIVRQIIEPEMANVITALNNRREEPVICKYTIDGVLDNAEYQELPPNVGQIIRIVKLDADGNIVNDIEQRDGADPRGPGWHVDGRDLHFRPLIDTTEINNYEVWYIPSGDFNPHYSAAGGTLAGLNAVTLDVTPDVGMVDMRESAYVGGILRVWGDTNTVVQERVITSYNADTKVVGVRTAFIAPIANGAVIYEIVPEFMGHVWQSIALASAMNLGVARNINEKQMMFLKEQFAITIQTAGSLLSQKINNKSIAPENSVLYTMLQRIQWGVPDKVESVNKSFADNDFIMRSVVIPKMAEVMTAINNRTDSPIVVRHSLTLVTDQEYYDLPPCVYKALRIAQLTSTADYPKGLVKDEIRQNSENDPNGNGWSIQGNRLSIRPYPTVSTSYSLWYIPSGDFIPHYASDGSLDVTGKILTLTSGGLFSRMLGYVDKRNNAYAGATLRVFEKDGSISERTITSHSVSSGGAYSNKVTVTEAFTTKEVGGYTVAYEIVAPWMTQIMNAVVAKSVLELVALKGQIAEADIAILSESAKTAMSGVVSNIRERNAQEIVPNPDSSLHTVLEKTKTIIGDIAKELNYTDDYIFRQGIMPEYTRVMSRIQNSSSDYVIQKSTISLVKNQQYYSLPACIGEILRIVTSYDDGRIKTELLPRNQFSSRGPNWSLEGNELAIRPYPSINEDVEIWYIPTTDIKPHYAEDGQMNSAGTSLATDDGGGLSRGGWGSQILGEVDRREEIYKGCVCRILAPISGVIQERVIKEHSANGRWLSFRNSFTDSAFANAVVTYEIVPAHFTAVSEAVAQAAAMNLLVSARRVTKAQHVMLLSNFKSAMKTALDHFTFLQNRRPKKYEKDTVDNKDGYGGIYGIR